MTYLSTTFLQDRWEQFILNYIIDGAHIKSLNPHLHLS
jgi:hypothetical protein